MTTLRLLLPQWQGGLNPNYVLGAELLSLLAPPSAQDETVRIPVSLDFEGPLAKEQGLDRYQDLMVQLEATERVLTDKKPDRIITFGGDCAVSQAPFAYLSERYGDKFGILWLDAHPDIATTADSSHLHEMVLGNLIGQGAPAFAKKVGRPVSPQRVFYAGLIAEDLRPGLDDGVHQLGLAYAGPRDLSQTSQPILDWIKREGLAFLAVHFDLDVLSPYDFRSIYPAEPGTRIEDFPAAVGELSLEQVVRILTDLSAQTDLVGLTIAEHLPWDAIRLRQALAQISIFQD